MTFTQVFRLLTWYFVNTPMQQFSEEPFRLCQGGSGWSVYGYFQVSPEMTEMTGSSLVAGPLKSVNGSHSCGCVFRVTVMLELEVLSSNSADEMPHFSPES